MTSISKRFWKWDDERFNLTEYKLRADIKILLERGLAFATEEKDQFTGRDGFPRLIRAINNSIRSIHYSDRFIGPQNIWDLEQKRFEEEVNKQLQPTSEADECDKLFVFFRGGFVSIAGIVAFEKIE